MSKRITIIGVTSEPGRALFFELAKRNCSLVGIGRDIQKLTKIRTQIGEKFPLTEVRNLDVERDDSFLSDTDVLIHCSRPHLVKRLLSKNLSHLIALGSTRKFTQYPDSKHKEVIEMEHDVLTSAVPATILHPTMIYGATTQNNIRRIIQVAKSWPMIPLPLNGRQLIQPIHNDDVVKAIIGCMNNARAINKSIIIAGPSPMSYRKFVEKIIAATGYSCQVIAFPYPLIKTISKLTKYIPNLPNINDSEVRRLLEDKNFDTLHMQKVLNLRPRSFEEGILQFVSLSSRE